MSSTVGHINWVAPCPKGSFSNVDPACIDAASSLNHFSSKDPRDENCKPATNNLRDENCRPATNKQQERWKLQTSNKKPERQKLQTAQVGKNMRNESCKCKLHCPGLHWFLWEKKVSENSVRYYDMCTWYTMGAPLNSCSKDCSCNTLRSFMCPHLDRLWPWW